MTQKYILPQKQTPPAPIPEKQTAWTGMEDWLNDINNFTTPQDIAEQQQPDAVKDTVNAITQANLMRQQRDSIITNDPDPQNKLKEIQSIENSIKKESPTVQKAVLKKVFNIPGPVIQDTKPQAYIGPAPSESKDKTIYSMDVFNREQRRIKLSDRLSETMQWLDKEENELDEIENKIKNIIALSPTEYLKQSGQLNDLINQYNNKLTEFQKDYNSANSYWKEFDELNQYLETDDVKRSRVGMPVDVQRHLIESGSTVPEYNQKGEKVREIVYWDSMNSRFITDPREVMKYKELPEHIQKVDIKEGFTPGSQWGRGFKSLGDLPAHLYRYAALAMDSTPIKALIDPVGLFVEGESKTVTSLKDLAKQHQEFTTNLFGVMKNPATGLYSEKFQMVDITNPVRFYQSVAENLPLFVGLAATYSTGAGFAAMGLAEAGETMEEIEKYENIHGKLNPDFKLGLVTVVGGLNAQLEKLGFEAILGKGVFSKFKKSIGSKLLDLGVEVFTEGLQGGNQYIAKSLYDEFEKFGLGKYFERFKDEAIGAIPVTMLGGGGPKILQHFGEKAEEHQSKLQQLQQDFDDINRTFARANERAKTKLGQHIAETQKQAVEVPTTGTGETLTAENVLKMPIEMQISELKALGYTDEQIITLGGENRANIVANQIKPVNFYKQEKKPVTTQSKPVVTTEQTEQPVETVEAKPEPIASKPKQPKPTEIEPEQAPIPIITPPDEEKQKQPWEMTLKEWTDTRYEKGKKNYGEDWKPVSGEDDFNELLRLYHLKYIKEAISEDKPVPEGVLRDYPELAGKVKPAETKPTEVKPAEAASVEKKAESLSVITANPKDIIIVESKFQPRESYNQSIIDDIAQNYDPGKWDEPVLWKNPEDSKYYIVSGHHRHKGVLQGNYTQVKYKVLPEGTTLEQARDYAEVGNLARTEQTDFENANVVRRRIERGDTPIQIANDLPGLAPKAKTDEGKRNAVNNLVNLAYLNPRGDFKANYGSTNEFPRIVGMAKNVGSWRKKYPWMTDRHESDIFTYLYVEKGIAGDMDAFELGLSRTLKRMDEMPENERPERILPSLRKDVLQPAENTADEILQKINDLKNHVETISRQLDDPVALQALTAARMNGGGMSEVEAHEAVRKDLMDQRRETKREMIDLIESTNKPDDSQSALFQRRQDIFPEVAEIEQQIKKLQNKKSALNKKIDDLYAKRNEDIQTDILGAKPTQTALFNGPAELAKSVQKINDEIETINQQIADLQKNRDQTEYRLTQKASGTIPLFKAKLQDRNRKQHVKEINRKNRESGRNRPEADQAKEAGNTPQWNVPYSGVATAGEAVSRTRNAQQSVEKEIGEKYERDWTLAEVKNTPEFQATMTLMDVFGQRGIFIDAGESPSGFGFNGLTYGGSIYINAGKNLDPNHSMFFTAGHELVHRLKQEHPDLYKKLQDVIEEETNDIDGVLRKYVVDYTELKGRDHLAFEDFVADVMGDAMQEESFWQKVYAKSPQLFRKLLDILNQIIKRLKFNKSAYGVREFINNLERVHDVASSVLAEYAERVESAKSKNESGQVGFQTIEPNAVREAKSVQLVKDKDGNLLAPNGKKSKLTEYQWKIVRTPTFKKWFGDWELAKIKNNVESLKPTEITNKVIAKEEAQNIYKSLSNVTHYSTQQNIKFVNKTIKKIQRHNEQSLILRAIPQFDKLLENSEFIYYENERSHEQHPNIIGYHNYLNLIKIDGEEYFIRFTVQEVKTDRYELHDTFVSDVQLYKKDNLISLSGVSKPGIKKTALLDNKLNEFFNSIQDISSSKVVDENGEPLVVYHGGTVGNVFSTDFSGAGGGREGAFFFTPDVRQAKDYAGTGEVKAVFLNLRSPVETDAQLDANEVEQAKGAGKDGYWIVEDGLIEESEIAVFNPTQIKSIFNQGTFSPEDERILFQPKKESALAGQPLFQRKGKEKPFKFDDKTGALPKGLYTHPIKIGNKKNRRHKDFWDGKSGDNKASDRAVEDLVKPEAIEFAKSFGKDAIFVPIRSLEGTGENQIPTSLADYLSSKAEAILDTNIKHINKPEHTGKSVIYRILNPLLFDGKVEKGGQYVLIDDTVATGGSLADLGQYIEENGGKVVGIMTLVNASRSSNLTPSKELINELQKKFGKEIEQEFGIKLEALTYPEAIALNRFQSIDAIRNRISTERHEAESTRASETLGQATDDQSDRLKPQFQRKPKTPRQKALARAHILEKEIGLTPEEVSTNKKAITGNESLAKASDQQISAYVDFLIEKKTGNKPIRKPKVYKKTLKDYQREKQEDKLKDRLFTRMKKHFGKNFRAFTDDYINSMEWVLQNRFGAAGKTLHRRIKDAEYEIAEWVKPHEAELETLLKNIPHKERQFLRQIIESGQPISPETEAFMQWWNKLTDDIFKKGKQYVNKDLRQIKNYFPLVLRPDFYNNMDKNHPLWNEVVNHVQEELNKRMSYGQLSLDIVGVTREEAESFVISFLNQYKHKGTRVHFLQQVFKPSGKYRHSYPLEMHRDRIFPEWAYDDDVIGIAHAYIDKSYTSIAYAKNLKKMDENYEYEEVTNLIGKIEDEGYDAGFAKDIVAYILGLKTISSNDARIRSIAKELTTFLLSIGTSVKNFGDIAKSIAWSGNISTLSTLGKLTTSKSARKQGKNLIGSKYVFTQSMQDFGIGSKLSNRWTRAIAFMFSESTVRKTTGLSAISAAKNLLKNYKPGDTSRHQQYIKRQLDRLTDGLDIDFIKNRGYFTDSEIARIGNAAIGGTQPASKMDKPYKWEAGLMTSIATIFKSFGHRGIRFVKDFIKSEMMKGNFRPAINFIVWRLSLGYAIEEVMAFLFPKDDKEEEDTVAKLWRILTETGELSVLPDILFAIRHDGWISPWISLILGPFFGVGIETVYKTGRTVNKLIKGDKDPLKPLIDQASRYTVKRIPFKGEEWHKDIVKDKNNLSSRKRYLTKKTR